MKLRRLGKSLAVVSVFAVLARGFSKADVTITKHVKQSGAISGESTRTLRIKGLRMRIDTTTNGESRWSIYDLNSGKAYHLNPKGKEVMVVDLKSASEHLKDGFSTDKLTRVIKETGRKREVSGKSCDEYTFDLQAPNGPALIQHDKGIVCVSQTILEGLEVTNFVLEAMKRGYIYAAGELSPSQSSLGPYFFGQQPNVLILAASSESRVDGPLREVSPMSNITSMTLIGEIKSDPIPNEEFQIPPDWKEKKSHF